MIVKGLTACSIVRVAAVTVAVLCFCAWTPAAGEPVIERFETQRKQVALTFDACSTSTPPQFDGELLDYLVNNRIPSTLFLSGTFIKANREKVRELGRLDFIELENHAYRHLHHRDLDEKAVEDNVLRNGALITRLTGRRPVFFRFPFGEYDERSLAEVERLGYRVVHWTFESGDPDEAMTKDRLVQRVVRKTRPGSILIFHINGRGWHTRAAIVEIVDQLRAKGYEFVLLKDTLRAGPPAPLSAAGR